MVDYEFVIDKLSITRLFSPFLFFSIPQLSLFHMPIIDWTGKGTGQNHARISILERTRCFVGEIFTRFNLCSLRTVSRRRLFSTLNPKYGVFSPLTGMDLSAPAVFLTKVDMT